MIYPSASFGQGRDTPWRLKWFTEFWGFCVNGTSSLTVPGGLAANNGTNMPGNFMGAATTIASGSNGAALPQTTINVASTTGFPTSGTIYVYTTGGTQTVTYTGTNTTQFTGCSGGVGTMVTGNNVTSSSLLTLGSDGYHPAVPGDLFSGDCVFTAQTTAPFTASMIGKTIVIWKPNSDSSEDSIYFITRVLNSSQIVININTGGTPNPTTKHPSMTQRSSVNYRVVDMEVGALAGYTSGGYVVYETAASTINPGQANSQFQIAQGGTTGAAGSNSPGLFGMSGTGSWNGTPFTITAATNASPIVATTSVPHGLTTGQTVTISGGLGNTAINGNWIVSVTSTTSVSLTGSTGNGTYTASSATLWNGFQNDGYSAIFSFTISTNQAYTSGQSSVTMIADKTFGICHIRDQDLFQTNGHIEWHFEIPQRLYPQGADLHPMAILVQTLNTGLIYTSSTTLSYGGGFIMRSHSSDTTAARSYRTLVKAMQGDGEIQVNGSPVSPAQGVFGQNLSDYRLGFNTIAGTVPVSDGILCLPGVSNQWALGRARLRTVKFTGTHIPKHHRIGLNGEFIQMQNGICWPWDNTIIPFQLLLFG